MFCIHHFIPLFLLPFPQYHPLFCIILLVCVYYQFKPCFYCCVLLAGLLASSCSVGSYHERVSKLSTDDQFILAGWIKSDGNYTKSLKKSFYNPPDNETINEKCWADFDITNLLRINV
jgi:hypothetical protein